MISQADIIRTLVNKNCTDEAIMSTALSPDCTPPKLLEKFTEAERFDLALDVSMKLGLDVSPLWKTWAMRYLRNRNFQGAREKFKHCFSRFNSTGGRGSSSASSTLLRDILDELVKIDTLKLPLADEVELIKQRRSIFSPDMEEPAAKFEGLSIRSAGKERDIYSECLYYLNEYGNIEDKIRFFIRNALWDRASNLLIEHRNQINADKFFISEVMVYLTSTGCFDKLLAVLIKLDPNITITQKYFKAIYNYCTIHKRFNMLYYILTTIGDYVAGARIQVNSFFLKKPTQSYRELNHRVGNLINARRDYQYYLNRLEQARDSTTNSDSLQDNGKHLFSHMTLEEVRKQLETIDFQIDLTRNFSINEVLGCINDIQVAGFVQSADQKRKNNYDDSPVTLFDQSQRRKTFLAALVLIYFDLTCSSYFSKSGLDLANKIIVTYELDKLNVFKTAMRVIIEDESCDLVDNASLLLGRIKEDYHAAQASSQRRPTSRQPLSPNSKTSRVGRAPQLTSTSPSSHTNRSGSLTSSSTQSSPAMSVTPEDAARALCDDVIRDAIGNCREPDYKMELAKLLSDKAKIELYIELGKLSNAQALAFSMNRPDYVSIIVQEAAKLKQNHVKTVCELWLAKRS